MRNGERICNRQGNDVGTSYRSAIFYTSNEQRRIAEDTIADVDASGLWPGKVVTEVFQQATSGKLNLSIRTTSNDILAATPAIRPAKLEAADSHGCCCKERVSGDGDCTRLAKCSSEQARALNFPGVLAAWGFAALMLLSEVAK